MASHGIRQNGHSSEIYAPVKTVVLIATAFLTLLTATGVISLRKTADAKDLTELAVQVSEINGTLRSIDGTLDKNGEALNTALMEIALIKQWTVQHQKVADDGLERLKKLETKGGSR